MMANVEQNKLPVPIQPFYQLVMKMVIIIIPMRHQFQEAHPQQLILLLLPKIAVLQLLFLMIKLSLVLKSEYQPKVVYLPLNLVKLLLQMLVLVLLPLPLLIPLLQLVIRKLVLILILSSVHGPLLTIVKQLTLIFKLSLLPIALVVLQLVQSLKVVNPKLLMNQLLLLMGQHLLLIYLQLKHQLL